MKAQTTDTSLLAGETMHILTIGTIYIDIKGHSYSEFIPDGRNAGYIEYVHGGVGRNIAEDIANLGADSTFFSLYGTDSASLDAVLHLKEIGVNTDFLKKSEDGSGTWLAIFNEKGNVVSSISKRPNLDKLYDVLIESHEALFKNADAVILEIDLPTNVVSSVFEYAKLYNVPVYCPVATMSHAIKLKEYLKNAECFICNLQEAEMLFETGLNFLSLDKLSEFLCEEIKVHDIKSIVVTLGDKGCVYALADGGGICHADKVAQIDSTGAGDSFCAAFTVARTRGMTFKDACLAASKVAAEVVASKENVYIRKEKFDCHLR